MHGLFPGERFSHCLMLFEETLSELPGPEYFGGLFACAFCITGILAANTPVNSAVMTKIANILVFVQDNQHSYIKDLLYYSKTI